MMAAKIRAWCPWTPPAAHGEIAVAPEASVTSPTRNSNIADPAPAA